MNFEELQTNNKSWLENLTETLMIFGKEATMLNHEDAFSGKSFKLHFVTEKVTSDNHDDQDNEDDEQEDETHDHSSLCRKEMWRCLSSVVERGIPCFGKSEGLME